MNDFDNMCRLITRAGRRGLYYNGWRFGQSIYGPRNARESLRVKTLLFLVLSYFNVMFYVDPQSMINRLPKLVA